MFELNLDNNLKHFQFPPT